MGVGGASGSNSGPPSLRRGDRHLSVSDPPDHLAHRGSFTPQAVLEEGPVQLVEDEGLESCECRFGRLALAENTASGLHGDGADRDPDELGDQERLVADRAADTEDRAAAIERTIGITVVDPDRRIGGQEPRRGAGRLRFRQPRIDQGRSELQLMPASLVVGDGAGDTHRLLVLPQLVTQSTCRFLVQADIVGGRVQPIERLLSPVSEEVLAGPPRRSPRASPREAGESASFTTSAEFSESGT